MKESILMLDVEKVKELAKKFVQLNTISHGIIDLFDKNQSKNFEYIRKRLRNALNYCYDKGLCSKSYVGSNYYQTGDTLGGKVYISYDFTKYILNKDI